MEPGHQSADRGAVTVRQRPLIPTTGVHDVLDAPGPTVARARQERGDARDERLVLPDDRAQRSRDLLEADGRQMCRQVKTRLSTRPRPREELDDRQLPHDDRFIGLVDADGALRPADRVVAAYRSAVSEPVEPAATRPSSDAKTPSPGAARRTRPSAVAIGVTSTSAPAEPIAIQPFPSVSRRAPRCLRVGNPRNVRAARCRRRRPRSPVGHPLPARRESTDEAF